MAWKYAWVVRPERKAAQDELLVWNGLRPLVAFFRPHGSALRQRLKTQIETTQHFNQPLVLETLRNHDQRASGTFGNKLLVQYQTRLDGLAQPHLVRQQYPWSIAAGYFLGDIELVGQ